MGPFNCQAMQAMGAMACSAGVDGASCGAVPGSDPRLHNISLLASRAPLPLFDSSLSDLHLLLVKQDEHDRPSWSLPS